MENKKKKFSLFPAGVHTTTRVFGQFYVLSMIARSLYEYALTFFYILRVRGFRQAYSFFYTKMFVPAGEGAGAGIYFFMNGLIRKYPLLAPFPKYVEIETTTVCPRKCIMCEHTHWKDQEERHASFEEFKNIFDQFHGIRWLHLTGEGSSFCNPEYVKMLEYAKEKRTAVYLVDTFDMINETIMKQILDLRLEGVFLSIDGATAKTYEAIRVGCSFDRVLKNVRRFLEMKREMGSIIPEISFRYIILTENVHEMPAFVELVASLGKENLGRGARLDFVGNLAFPETERYSVSQVPEHILTATLQNAKKYGINVFLSHIEKEKNPCINGCIAWMEPYIIMGGYVMPCCSIMMSNQRTMLRKHSLGNVNQNTMKEIWNSERYRRFRQAVNDPRAKVPYLCTFCRAYDFSERAARYGIDESL